MSWFNREPKSYWEDLMEGNQEYLDTRRDPRGFQDTMNHLGTMYEGGYEAIKAWDSDHPEYDNGYQYNWDS